jgi:tetratricopeptide (TPR) repeat protein
VTALVFLGIIGYFLRIGLGVTGSALGPAAQQGDASLEATPVPGEVVVPQTGGGNGVGGGTPARAPAGGPPAPVQRLLTELRGRLAQNPRDVATLVGLAQLYFDAGKFERALPYYRRALALDPRNPDTRTDYAAALHATGSDLAALHQLESVLSEAPNFAPALFNAGIVASSIGRRTQAIAAFQRFLKVAPQDQRADDARTALRSLGA